MNHTKIREYLSGHGLFKGLPAKQLDFLAGAACVRKVAAQEVLFRFDDKADRFFLITDGDITVEVASIQGPPLELQRLGAGKVLGWSWLIPPYRWSFQARAVVPGELIEFDGVVILMHCEEDSSFGYALLKRFSGLMSERLTAARQRMMEEWRPAGFA